MGSISKQQGDLFLCLLTAPDGPIDIVQNLLGKFAMKKKSNEYYYLDTKVSVKTLLKGRESPQLDVGNTSLTRSELSLGISTSIKFLFLVVHLILLVSVINHAITTTKMWITGSIKVYLTVALMA